MTVPDFLWLEHWTDNRPLSCYSGSCIRGSSVWIFGTGSPPSEKLWIFQPFLLLLILSPNTSLQLQLLIHISLNRILSCEERDLSLQKAQKTRSLSWQSPTLRRWFFYGEKNWNTYLIFRSEEYMIVWCRVTILTRWFWLPVLQNVRWPNQSYIQTLQKHRLTSSKCLHICSLCQGW